MKNEGMRFGIVDKNGFNQRTYTAYINKHYKKPEVHPLSSVETALAIARSGMVDIMVVEYFLEDGTAMRLLREMGAELTREVPVVVVTNPGNRQMAQEVLEAGAVAYFERDADLLSLGRTLNEAIFKMLSKERPLRRVKEAVGRERLAQALSLESRPEKRLDVGDWHALLIGVSKYKDPSIPNLDAPPNDLALVADLLVGSYGFSKPKCLKEENASWQGIDNALMDYQQNSRENDSLLIFFAGHGLYEEGIEEGYWLPHNAEKNDPRSWYANHRLSSIVARIPMRHVLIIADCCFSGSLLETERDVVANRVLSNSNLKDYYVHGSRWALTSSRIKTVKDRGLGKNSPFVDALCETMRRAEDHLIPETLCAGMRENSYLQDLKQLPVCKRIKNVGENQGQFLFVRSR